MDWIIPCNLKYYNVEGAFKILSKIDWKQSTNIQVGDRVFIYIGAPVSSIRYQCKVNKVNLQEADIDDSAFNIDGTNYLEHGRYMELELVEEYSINELAIEKLRENGLNGNIQGPRKIRQSLKEYIEQFVGNNSLVKINYENEVQQKFIPEFKVGSIVTNQELSQAFHCGNMGGMRRSKTTGTLVIISDHTKMYNDKWYGDELHYTGMGKNGDQILEGNQNKTLAESDSNGVEVHLFEVFDAAKYTYQGIVKLAGKLYQENQLGEDGSQRKVWMFPLKKLEQQAIVDEKSFEHYLANYLGSHNNNKFEDIRKSLLRYKEKMYLEDDIDCFYIENENIFLRKKIGKSQYKEGVRINKDYHEIFNPNTSKYYVDRGEQRKIKILFNYRVFDGVYRYENQKDKTICLQRIGFFKPLKEEFEKVYPEECGEFFIYMGRDENHFVFKKGPDIIDIEDMDSYDKDETGYEEGRKLLKLHLKRERNPGVIKKAKKLFKKNNGKIFCEVCGFDFQAVYGERGEDYIEGHHKVWLSNLSEQSITKVDDIAMLCANCHRMIHRTPIITLDEMKKTLKV